MILRVNAEQMRDAIEVGELVLRDGAPPAPGDRVSLLHRKSDQAVHVVVDDRWEVPDGWAVLVRPDEQAGKSEAASDPTARIAGGRLVLSHQARAEAFETGWPPRVTVAPPCPVEPGYIYSLSSLVWLEVTSIERTHRGFDRLFVTLHDHRDPVRLLRRAPAMRKDDVERPIERPTAEAIEEARIDSSYTTRSHAAVPSAGEGLREDHMAEIQRRSAADREAEREQRRFYEGLLSAERRTVELQRQAKMRKVDIRSETRLAAKLISEGRDPIGPLDRAKAKLDQDLRPLGDDSPDEQRRAA